MFGASRWVQREWGFEMLWCPNKLAWTCVCLKDKKCFALNRCIMARNELNPLMFSCLGKFNLHAFRHGAHSGDSSQTWIQTTQEHVWETRARRTYCVQKNTRVWEFKQSSAAGDVSMVVPRLLFGSSRMRDWERAKRCKYTNLGRWDRVASDQNSFKP